MDHGSIGKFQRIYEPEVSSFKGIKLPYTYSTHHHSRLRSRREVMVISPLKLCETAPFLSPVPTKKRCKCQTNELAKYQKISKNMKQQL